MKYLSSIFITTLLLSFMVVPFAHIQAQESNFVIDATVETAIRSALKASASIPTVPTNDVANASKEVQMCFSFMNIGMCTPGLDKLAIMATKAFIERMVDSTVTWINTGFDGNPAYVTDPGQYFGDIADGVAGEFIKGSDLEFLCSPFKAQVQLSLVKQYYERQAFQCTLTDVVGNIEDFYGSFGSGGWDAWFSMTQNENNNPYGSYLNAKIELDSRIASAIGLKDKQLDWGRGFLSKETCNKNAQGVELRDFGTGKCTSPGPIVTPGAVIETQLQATLGTGISQLELADEFDELIGALLGQLLEKTVFSAKGLFAAESVVGNYPDPDPIIITPRTASEFFTGYCVGLNLDCSIFDEPGDKIFYMFTSPTDVIFYPQVTSVTPQGVEDVIHLELNGEEVQVCEADSALYAAGCMYHEKFVTSGNQTFYGYLMDRTLRSKPSIPDPSDPNSNPGSDSVVVSEKLIVIGNGSIIVPKERGTIGIIGGVEIPPGESGGGATPPGTQPTSLLNDLQTERAKFPTPMSKAQLGQLLNNVVWKNRASGWVLLGKDGNNCPSPAGPLISCDFLVHKPTMYGYDVLIDEGGAATPSWQGPDTTIAGRVNRGERTLVDAIAP